MKKAKLTKIFVLILSLALLIGSAVCVAASAADDDNYTIKSINISHADAIQVLIAVDAPASEAENVTVSYVYGGETIEATYWKNVDIYNDGTEYPVFYTKGIAIKDIGESVVAKAYKTGTDGTGAEEASVSVSDYLFTKLYKEGYIAQTLGEDAGRRQLYLNLLSYGAQAQEVLWNNKHPDELRTLVTDVNYVYAKDATVNGSDEGVVVEDGVANLAYTGADVLLGWQVYTVDGMKEVTGNTLTLDSAAFILPVAYEITTKDDFEGAYVKGTYNCSTSGTAPTVTFDTGFAVNYSGKTNTGVEGVTANAQVLTEENGNHYVNITSPGRGGATTDRGHEITVPAPTTIHEDANVTVLSFDLRGTASGTGTNGAIDVIMRWGSSSYTQFKGGSDGVLNLDDGDAWHNITIELWHDYDVVMYYNDGKYMGTLDKTGGEDYSAVDVATIYTVSIGAQNNGGALDLDIDNVLFYNIKKSIVPAEPDAAYGFEDDTVGSIGTNPTFTNYTFADGVLYVNNNRTNNACSGGGEIVQDGDNKYFYMWAGKRVQSTDRGWSFNNRKGAQLLVPAVVANVGVLELDLKVDSSLYVDGATQSSSSPIALSLYFGADAKYVRFDPKVSSGTITMAGYTIGSTDAWFTLRLVMNCDTQTIDVYSKPQGAEDWTRSFTIPADATVTDGAMSNMASGEFKGFDITGMNSGQMYSLSFDNISAYATHVER